MHSRSSLTPYRTALYDRARGQELRDGGLVVAGLAQDLDRVLAEVGRIARWHAGAAFDPERTGDGEGRAGARVVEGNEGAAHRHLPVVTGVIDGGDHAEGNLVGVEDRPPLGPRPLRERRVQDGDERAGMGTPGGR